MKTKLIILFLIFALVTTSGFGCKMVSKEVQEGMKPVTLNYWRVWDGQDTLAPLIAKYNSLHPFISINYKKFRYEEYEQALLDAFAEDRGPDIFSIDVAWLKKYESKILPIPDKISLVYPVEKGTLKKEVISEMRTTNSITPSEVRTNYIETVGRDVILNVYDEKTKTKKERVLGLPLGVDNLAMFYNKDLFNNAGITEAADYWDKQFQQDIKKLTKQNTQGEIIQSGVALGGSTNIERSNDILMALMMQNGAVIMSDNKFVFNQIPINLKDKGYNPGMEAIKFYCDFANSGKEVYSWNKDMNNSLEMFMAGKLAIMFGYSYQIPTIKAQAPKLNFAVKKFPQIKGNDAVLFNNTANYWIETVSKKTKNSNEAWDFVQFITTKPENAKVYLDKVKKPTALRSLIKGQIDDPVLSPFASQLLTSRSWYSGKNYTLAEEALSSMIDNIAKNSDSLESEVNIAVGKMQQTVK